MQYSPKLKKAMKEIQQIMDNYDIAGLVVLHTPGNAESFIKIDPSYSCAFFEPGAQELRIRNRLQEDCNGNKNLLRQRSIDTANLFSLLCDATSKLSINLVIASEYIDEVTKAEHTETGFTTDTTQNN